jgi:hypothetical protein
MQNVLEIVKMLPVLFGNFADEPKVNRYICGTMAEAMLTSPSTSKDLSETVDGLTVCSICLDTLKVPKYFSCLHTFCLACINGYLENIFRDRIPRSVNTGS